MTKVVSSFYDRNTKTERISGKIVFVFHSWPVLHLFQGTVTQNVSQGSSTHSWNFTKGSQAPPMLRFQGLLETIRAQPTAINSKIFLKILFRTQVKRVRTRAQTLDYFFAAATEFITEFLIFWPRTLWWELIVWMWFCATKRSNTVCPHSTVCACSHSHTAYLTK